MGIWLGVLGLAVGLASLGYAVLQRQVKRLTYQQSRSADLSPRAGVFEDVDVVYNGERLTRPWYSRVRIANDGNVEIRSDDFEVPLLVQWEGARLLAVKVTAWQPSGLRVECSLDGDSFSVEPLLMNVGDWFDVDVLLDGGQATPAIATRIAGVRSIEPVERRARRQDRWFTTLAGVVGVGGIALSGFVPGSALKGLWGVAVGVLVGIIVIIGPTLPGKGTAPFEGPTGPPMA